MDKNTAHIFFPLKKPKKRRNISSTQNLYISTKKRIPVNWKKKKNRDSTRDECKTNLVYVKGSFWDLGYPFSKSWRKRVWLCVDWKEREKQESGLSKSKDFNKQWRNVCFGLWEEGSRGRGIVFRIWVYHAVRTLTDSDEMINGTGPAITAKLFFFFFAI